MKTIPWDKNVPQIITKGIDSIKGIYLKKINQKTMESLPLLKAEQLFVFVIEDFKKGVLSPDDLANFGFKIFHSVAKDYPKSDLFQASLSASDLNFEMRTGGMRVTTCLKQIDDFYDKHK